MPNEDGVSSDKSIGGALKHRPGEWNQQHQHFRREEYRGALKPSTASWKWSYPKFPLVAAFGGALKHRYERLPDRRVQVSAGGPRRRIETGILRLIESGYVCMRRRRPLAQSQGSPCHILMTPLPLRQGGLSPGDSPCAPGLAQGILVNKATWGCAHALFGYGKHGSYPHSQRDHRISAATSAGPGHDTERGAGRGRDYDQGHRRQDTQIL